MSNLRSHRNTLGISQSRLARVSGVSRFKICTFELGDGSLSLEEQVRIRAALEAEADRLRSIPGRICFAPLQSPTSAPPLSRAEVAHVTGISVARLEILESGVERPTAEEFEKVMAALSEMAVAKQAQESHHE